MFDFEYIEENDEITESEDPNGALNHKSNMEFLTGFKTSRENTILSLSRNGESSMFSPRMLPKFVKSQEINVKNISFI